MNHIDQAHKMQRAAVLLPPEKLSELRAPFGFMASATNIPRKGGRRF